MIDRKFYKNLAFALGILGVFSGSVVPSISAMENDTTENDTTPKAKFNEALTKARDDSLKLMNLENMVFDDDWWTKFLAHIYSLCKSHNDIKKNPSYVSEDSTKKIGNIILRDARYILDKFKSLEKTREAKKNYSTADPARYNGGNHYAFVPSALKELSSTLNLPAGLKKELLNTFEGMYWDRYYELMDKGIKPEDYKDTYYNSLTNLEAFLAEL